MDFDYSEIKKEFKISFNRILDNNILLKHLLYEIFVIGSAYVVGGFLRDLIDKKSSRDVDMIVDVSHDQLLSFIKGSGIDFAINRHKGIKLQLKNIQVDIWSIEDNWAFKNKLVKLNDENVLDSIAKGCFFNYDSLVINIHTCNLNIKYYTAFLDKGQLDILQHNPKYKVLNPTVEANILRAFFIRKKFDCSYSPNAKMYLIKKIGQIIDSKKVPAEALAETQLKYPKYQILTVQDISRYISELTIDTQINNQMLFNL